jgi:hypothetical protein
MADGTVKKVSEKSAPKGAMGQTHLASGKRLAMPLWRDEQPHAKEGERRDYETVGYELTLEGQTIKGDPWLVPADSDHHYKIIESFTAVDATAPPAQVHGRDEK